MGTILNTLNLQNVKPLYYLFQTEKSESDACFYKSDESKRNPFSFIPSEIMGSHINAIIHLRLEGHVVDRLLHATAATDKHWRHQKGHCTKPLLLQLMESWCKLVVDFDLVVEVTSVNFTKVFNYLFHIRAHVGSQRVSTKSL